jgi:hypothetical protein
VDPYYRTVPGAKAVSDVIQMGPTPKADSLTDHYGTDKQYNLYGPQRRYNFDSFGNPEKTYFGAVEEKTPNAVKFNNEWYNPK